MRVALYPVGQSKTVQTTHMAFCQDQVQGEESDGESVHQQREREA
ncbi:MAG TPA: hypothetical protein VFA32_08460 [Dehalococcoidia bacterium]|nr:hypothetical protein [Dehalococcoidia bacterium]